MSPETQGTQKKKFNEESIQGYEDQHIETCLQDLKQHKGCQGALFCQSRRAFTVRREDNQERHFTIKGLSKNRKFFKAHKGLEDRLEEDHFKDLEQLFISAGFEAKEWLDWWPYTHDPSPCTSSA